MRRRHARCRAGTTAPLHAGAEARARFCTMAQSDLMLPRQEHEAATVGQQVGKAVRASRG